MSCTPLEKCKHGLGSFTWASCGQGRRDQSVTHGKEWSTRVGWVAPDWKGDEINSYKHAWTIIRRQVSHVCMPPPGRSIENDDHQNPSQPAKPESSRFKAQKDMAKCMDVAIFIHCECVDANFELYSTGPHESSSSELLARFSKWEAQLPIYLINICPYSALPPSHHHYALISSAYLSH
jgi:hypothetical protein